MYGHPQFIITDHGSLFRKRFKKPMEEGFGIQHARGCVWNCTLNGKCERFIRTATNYAVI